MFLSGRSYFMRKTGRLEIQWEPHDANWCKNEATELDGKWDFFPLCDINNSFPLSGNPFFKNEKNN